MRWSFRLGRIAGIDVNIHATFSLLILWVLLTHWLTGHTLAAAASAMAFVAAIFGCVLLHELGHALAARRFGIATRDITLLPIGGVARLERMPDKPLQELWVALAGPAVNVLIAIALWAWLAVTYQFVPLSQLGVTTGPFVERLLVVNVILIVFNMVPAFPMDGGRCVRALLALKLEHARATRIAAGLGQAIAVGFAVLGLFSNPFLIVIGVFVWLGAAHEARLATMKAALRGIPVRQALIRDVPVLPSNCTLAQAAEALRTSPQQTALVAQSGQLVGTLNISDLVDNLRQRNPGALVAEVMRSDFPVVEADDTLDGVLAQMREARCRVVPILADGSLIGIVTAEAIERFVAIQSAMQRGEAGTEHRRATPLAPGRPLTVTEHA
jgi:Zn-dependent protease/predicted transcriptional regulator